MRAIALALLALGITATAQTTTVVVRCRVLAAADSTPLRRARIIAIADARQSQPVFSDDDGRCEVPVPSDAHTLRVSKAGFAPQDLRITPRPPAAIEMRLAPAAVISGSVIDSRGEVAVRVGVMIRRVEPRDAPQPAETRVVTDDRGQYRIGNLVAGRFAVHTQRGMALTDSFDSLPAGAPAAAAARSEQALEPMSDTVVVDAASGEHLDVALVHKGPSVSFPYEGGGVVTGTLFDENGEPAEGARVVLLATGDTGMGSVPAEVEADDRGQFRAYHLPPGPHLVVVSHPSDAGPSYGAGLPVLVFGAPPDPLGYLPVYYPGKLDPGEAVPLPVERGQELQAIDMVVPRVRGWRLFGILNSGAGLRTSIELRPIGRSAAARVRNRTATASAGGGFELRNVPPGSYVLQHVSEQTGDSPGAGGFAFVSLRLNVSGEDVGPLTMTTAPTSTIRGRITLEGAAARVEPKEFRLTVLPVDPADAPAPGLISSGARIEADWTFRIAGLATSSRIGLTRGPPGWWLKSVTIGGVNAAEEPAPFGSLGDSRDDVAIVLSRNGATLAGRVVDDQLQQVDLYNVIVFATDRRRWFEGSAYVKSSSPRSDGRFTVTSLPPGDYFVGAIEYSENDPAAADVLQPEMLSLLARSSQRISVGEGQQQSAQVRLVRLPR